MHAQSLSCVQLFETLRAVANISSVGFSRQEYWSGLPCPPPGDLPNPGMEPVSPALQVNSLSLSHLGSQRRREQDKYANKHVR